MACFPGLGGVAARPELAASFFVDFGMMAKL